jgi:Serine/threonine protein kinase
MGEVYRAKDTRLDRTVALKVLAQHVSAASSARERFEREARAISALNHPNICTLFDVGSENGTEYLVMELIDGESLSERITKGPMPLEAVLRIGAAVAGALAKAHDSGIVHRDLKPGNVMLTKSGPKLLDFGLARKAAEEIGTGTSPDAETRVEKALTAEGTILGTLPYMAPEQLEGQATDARTDIFALGCVLYEMTTGRRAFNAKSQASLISKIMSEHPVPIRQLQPIAPAGLHRLIMKCLAKDPDERWQCAADVASDLRWMEENPEQPVASATQRRPFAAWGIAAICALAAVVLGVALLGRPAATTRTLRFNIAPPQRGAFAFSTTAPSLAVSPDGTKVAYAVRDVNNARKLWIYDLVLGTSKALDVPNGSTSPFWSPDSHSIGFLAAAKLKTISIDEGAPQTVCDATNGGLSAAWMPDGTILFSQALSSGGILAVPSTGGTPRKVVEVKDAVDVVASSAIGETRHFFYLLIDKHTSSIWTGDLDGGAPRKLISGAGRPVYEAPYLLFVREGTLFAQRFDEKKMQLDGVAVRLADGVWFYGANGLSHDHAAGDTLAWAGSKQSTSLTWIDRTGHVIGEALAPNSYTNGRISPDGRRYATGIADSRTLTGDIWIADLGRKSLTRMTFGDHDHVRPVWSADGRSIAFAANQDGPPSIFTQTLGAGDEHPLTKPGMVQRVDDWLHDGRIFFNTDQPKTGADIFIARPDGGVEPWLQTPAVETAARISPDQRWVAYVSDDSGQIEVYVAPLDHHTDRVRVSTSGGSVPQWSRDGRELYFVSGGDLFSAAVTATSDSIDFAAPNRIYSADQDINAVDTAPDGRLLVSIRLIAPATQPLNVMVGWKEEAARLLSRK